MHQKRQFIGLSINMIQPDRIRVGNNRDVTRRRRAVDQLTRIAPIRLGGSNRDGLRP